MLRFHESAPLTPPGENADAGKVTAEADTSEPPAPLRAASPGVSAGAGCAGCAAGEVDAEATDDATDGGGKRGGEGRRSTSREFCM